MGSSSYFFNILPGNTVANPVLTYVNPKYTVGSPTSSYDTMRVRMFGTAQTIIGLNLFYNGNGGDIISGDPGFNGLGEKIATVSLDILMPVQVSLTFNLEESNIIGTDLSNTLNNNYFGIFTGTLPVELTGFSCNIDRNNVSLNWSTTSETNNHGFEIERSDERSQKTNAWTKIGSVAGNGTTTSSQSYSFTDKNLSSGNYSYRLKQLDFNGNFEYFMLNDEVIVGVPSKFDLSQNYPNPFNPVTRINFSLPADSKISLTIFDLSGRIVSTLFNNEFKAADYYTISFNGSELSSGTYFYTIKTDRNSETKKMILIK
jgi:hypothetical protein